MSSDKKYEKFWIAINLEFPNKSYVTDKYPVEKYLQENLTPVIEHAALLELQSKHEKLVELKNQEQAGRVNAIFKKMEAIEQYNSLKAKADKLRVALAEWIEWENEQIAKEGHYVGVKINELIKKGKNALKEYDLETK